MQGVMAWCKTRGPWNTSIFKGYMRNRRHSLGMGFELLIVSEEQVCKILVNKISRHECCAGARHKPIVLPQGGEWRYRVSGKLLHRPHGCPLAHLPRLPLPGGGHWGRHAWRQLWYGRNPNRKNTIISSLDSNAQLSMTQLLQICVDQALCAKTPKTCTLNTQLNWHLYEEGMVPTTKYSCPLHQNKTALPPKDRYYTILCTALSGDGYIIDYAAVHNSGASDASGFFNRLVKKPYASQFMAAPHIYCGEVTGQTYGTSGKALYNRLTLSFGHLTLGGTPHFALPNQLACVHECQITAVILLLVISF